MKRGGKRPGAGCPKKGGKQKEARAIEAPAGALRDAATGRFLPGNRFWEARSSHGARPKFTSAADLWSACQEYFEWVDANPLYEAKAFAFQGKVTQAELPKMRAMTIAGLCLFLDIEEATWREWRQSRSDLSAVMTRAEAVIYQQKFSGAAADLLNANIIARDLGLKDHSEIDHRGSVATFNIDTTDPHEAARVYQDIIAGIK